MKQTSLITMEKDEIIDLIEKKYNVVIDRSTALLSWRGLKAETTKQKANGGMKKCRTMQNKQKNNQV